MCSIKGITATDRGTLIITMIRSILLYGLEARGVSARDLHKLELIDNKITRIITATPIWSLKDNHINHSDLHYRLNLPPLNTAINYKKAAYIAHTMRQDSTSIPKLALTGRFFPSLTNTTLNNDSYFWDPKYKVDHVVNKHKYAGSVLGDAYTWLHHKCNIPETVMQYLFNKEHSHLFYKITREQFIRETITHYNLGNTPSPSQISDRSNSMCKQYNIENIQLDTLDDLLNSGICFLCGKRHNEDSLDSHIKSAHCPSFELTHDAIAALAKFEKRMEDKNSEHHNYILQQYTDEFHCIDHTTKKTIKDYHCHLCDFKLNTSIAAMLAHLETHKRDDFIKISRVIKNSSTCSSVSQKLLYRPEEHYFSATTGQYQRQGDMEIFKVIIPTSYNRIGDSLVCRKCKLFQVQFYDIAGNPLPANISSRNATRLQKHELTCR